MKKSILVISIICFFLTSCINIFNKEEKSGENGSGQNTPVTKEENGTAIFVNKSKFAVNVYKNLNPYNDEPFCVVPANQSLSIETKESSDQELGDVFYFEYLIKIGNAGFPYWTKEASSGYKSAAIKRKQSTEIEIDEINKCESKSAYLLIENNSTSNIRVNNANTPLKPYAAKDALINNKGGCGVYEVSPLKLGESSDINLGHLDGVKIKVDVTNEIALPVSNSDVVAGNIYTISVNTDNKGVSSASLKAVTPFNIDTQNKIWALDNPIFSTEYPIVMRPSYDGKSTLVMGSARKNFSGIIADGPGIICLDEYGNNVYGDDKFFALSSNPECLKTSKVIDFIEQQDGSVVILCNNIYKNGDDAWEDYLIVRYDFKTKTPLWYKFINSSVQLKDGSWYTLVFRNDSKNKLIKLAEDKFVCVGAYDHFAFNQEGLDYDRLHYMIIYIDGTNTNSDGVVAPESFKTIFSTDYTDLTKEIERNLTSAYYDGTDLYICGYDNWEHTDYTTTHVGKIWKASITDLANGVFDFSNNIVYSCDNCLFFSIDGIGSNYVVCGEYKDKGKVLKGCHVTSGMIKADAACTPVLYTVQNKQSCWFNQLCQYENKIVLCGKAAASMDGKDSPLPFVVAYDYNGNKLWENLSFTNYTSALNIIPNTIGTYMLQLEGKSGIIHYVNADLLGNEKK